MSLLIPQYSLYIINVCFSPNSSSGFQSSYKKEFKTVYKANHFSNFEMLKAIANSDSGIIAEIFKRSKSIGLLFRE